MRITPLRNAALAAAAALIPAVILGLMTGPDPRYTAAPGDKPKACATGGCHSAFKTGSEGGPINAFGGSVSATFSQGSTYTPGGGPVTITVRVGDPQNTTYGFQMTARLESDLAAAQAGRFDTSGNAGLLVLCENGSPRIPSGNCSQNFPLEFIEHSHPGTGAFTFTWTPPAVDAGPVHFYVAGNAVNNNQLSDAGDHVYTNQYVLDPAGACTDAPPSIAAVISAGAFGAREDFAAGSWLEIYGQNFSTVTKEWGGLDFQGAHSENAPTMLDRVSVSINGKAAYTRFISPGQVNVQAPADAFIGSANITVSNCGRTSEAFPLPKNPAAPGMLSPPAFNIDGKQFLAATFQDGATFVGDIPGVPSRPAKPGDLIIAYGIGFGSTDPDSPPGTVVSDLNHLAAPLSVKIGDVELPAGAINYAGLTPGFIGLYQFNLSVPDVPDGDQPVVIKIGGETVPQMLFLKVRR